MHKRCHCVSIPESSSRPSASVFFGPVLWGRVWRDKALTVYRQIYIDIYCWQRKKRWLCFFGQQSSFVPRAHQNALWIPNWYIFVLKRWRFTSCLQDHSTRRRNAVLPFLPSPKFLPKLRGPSFEEAQNYFWLYKHPSNVLLFPIRKYFLSQ